MTVFLTLKQIVDMLYQFKFLDYGMVLFAIVLFIYKIVKDKVWVNIRNRIHLADVLISGMVIIYLLAYVRNTDGFEIFVKVETCFLMYFLGRLYSFQTEKAGRWLAGAGYIVIYSNLIARLVLFEGHLIASRESMLAEGGLYYYKTDLAIGVIIAIIFIYAYSECLYLKWITIVPVSGYMVFYSQARMGKIVLLSIYVYILFSKYLTISVKNLKRKYIVSSITLIVILAIFFISIQIFPFEKYMSAYFLTEESFETNLVAKIMHSRHTIWWDLLYYFREQPLITRLCGIDLITDFLHTSSGDRSHSTYIKQVYATGYLGCITMIMLVQNIFFNAMKLNNLKIKWPTIALWIAFAEIGLTIEALELTQMSWFPMFFAGAMMTQIVEKSEQA